MTFLPGPAFVINPLLPCPAKAAAAAYRQRKARGHERTDNSQSHMRHQNRNGATHFIRQNGMI